MFDANRLEYARPACVVPTHELLAFSWKIARENICGERHTNELPLKTDSISPVNDQWVRLADGEMRTVETRMQIERDHFVVNALTLFNYSFIIYSLMKTAKANKIPVSIEADVWLCTQPVGISHRSNWFFVRIIIIIAMQIRVSNSIIIKSAGILNAIHTAGPIDDVQWHLKRSTALIQFDIAAELNCP